MDEKRIPQPFYSKDFCCGCGVCALICPKSAIEMVRDNEGFLYPEIDNEKCVCCYQCEKICDIRRRINEQNGF